MPCSGPSQELAYKVGDEIYAKVVDLLAEEHVHPTVGLPSAKINEEQQNNFNQLNELLRKIVWFDHAASF